MVQFKEMWVEFNRDACLLAGTNCFLMAGSFLTMHIINFNKMN